jgi:hypothetical protein
MNNVQVKSGVRLAESMKSTFSEVIESYEYAQKREVELTGMQQDLLHEIEWTEKAGAVGGYKMFKKLQEIRIERRKCKMDMKSLKPMYDYLSSKGKMGDQLDKLIVDSKSAKKGVVKVTYMPRSGETDRLLMNKLTNKFNTKIEWD